MGRYVIRRLLQAIPVLLGSTFLIFAIVYALPGDPVAALGGEKRIDPILAAQLREKFHLNDPLIVQYGYYVRDIFTGDFGQTFRGVPVSTIFQGKFQVTFQLAMTALTIEAVIGLGLGLFAALRRGRWEDQGILAITLLLVSYLGADLGQLMGGAVITEAIFNLPGIGQQLFASVYLRENPVVVGIVTLLVLIYLLANLVVDLLYAVLDPRIRYE